MSEVKDIYKAKGIKGVHIALSFFLVVTILTLGLYFYSFSLDKKNNEISEDLKTVEESIAQKKKNENIQIYDLYTLNKETLSRLDAYSKVVDFINHLEEISQRYRISFKGFNYSNGVLSLEVIAKSGDDGLDFQKTANFIKSYRKKEDALFSLGFINTVSTIQDRERFNIELKLKQYSDLDNK